MSNDSVRVKATGNIQVDNERVRVTEYTFKSGAETAFHRHEGIMSLYLRPMASCYW